jgi:hypothetical protein
MEDIVLSLAREYIDVVESLRSGVLDPQALHDMEAQRGALHEQLLQFLGETRMSVQDMYRRAKQIVLSSTWRGA